MLIEELMEAANSKFGDIIEQINIKLLSRIKNIPLEWKSQNIYIDIYTLFNLEFLSTFGDTKGEIVNFYKFHSINDFCINENSNYDKDYAEEPVFKKYQWESWMNIEKLKTNKWTTFVEIFQNDEMIKRIRERYISLGIECEIILAESDKLFYKIEDTLIYHKYDMMTLPHYRVIKFTLNEKSYTTSLLSEKVSILTQEKLDDLSDIIKEKALLKIQESPEKWLCIGLHMRDDIFCYPEDKEWVWDSSIGYYDWAESYNYKESETWAWTSYQEIFWSTKITNSLISRFHKQWIELNPQKALDWSYNILQLDLTNMKNDRSELFNNIKNIDMLTMEKQQHIQEEEDKIFTEHTQKIDAIILSNAIKLSWGTDNILIFRADKIFDIPHKMGNSWERDDYIPEERNRHDDYDFEYTDDLGETQRAYSWNTSSEYVDLWYEVNFRDTQFYHKHWGWILEYYSNNGFNLACQYSETEPGNENATGYGSWYNYLLISSIEWFKWELKIQIAQPEDTNKSPEDYKKALYFLIVIVVIMILLMALF